jgi:type IV pilus assembly protein PilO
MALLPTDQRSQVMMLLTLLALGAGYAFWHFYYQPASEQITSTKAAIDSLQTIVERAKQDLARGTMEDLRLKVERYRGMLGLMRRLVPEQNEVPAMIDDISTRAKVRGVTIGKIEPLPVEPGPPFDTYRYRLEIMGHYDQLGEYLSDIASLPRIVVPQDVILKAASAGAQKLLGDTVGALLEADFSVRTFVKSTPPPASPKPAAKPAKAK